jgi:type I restriction enzyme S subunit
MIKVTDFPSHWRVVPAWSLYERVKRTGNPDKELLSVYRDYGVIPKSSRDDNHNVESEDLSSYQLVQAGDLVVNKMKAWQGSFAVSDFEGIVSPAYFVYKSKHRENSRFLHYLLRSAPYMAHYNRISSGVRIGQWDLDPSQFRVTGVGLPPRSEQDVIVEFLDRELNSIDQLIEKQLKLIEAIKLRFQTRLDQYVTGGFRSNQMKPTSHQWLTEIPTNWTMGRLKLALRSPVTDGPHTTPVFEPDGFPFLSVDGIQDGELVFQNCRYVSQPDFVEFAKKARPELGDILMGKAASVGKIARVKTSKPFAIWSPLALLKIDKSHFDPSFIEFFLKSTFVQSQIQAISNSNTQQNLGMNQIPNLILVYPDLEKQVEISQAISDQLETGQQTITKAVEVVDRLRERRQALICSAVTGKISAQGAE